MKSIEEVLVYIDEQIEFNTRQMDNARSSGVNCPGFNQPLGAYDELLYLKEFILEND